MSRFDCSMLSFWYQYPTKWLISYFFFIWHKILYCQAQPQFQLQLGWVSFILDFPHHISCATTTTYPAQPTPHILRNHHHISCATTTRASSEIAGNEQNLLTNICRPTLAMLKNNWKILEKWKTTFMEDKLNARWPKRLKISKTCFLTFVCLI